MDKCSGDERAAIVAAAFMPTVRTAPGSGAETEEAGTPQEKGWRLPVRRSCSDCGQAGLANTCDSLVRGGEVDPSGACTIDGVGLRRRRHLQDAPLIIKAKAVAEGIGPVDEWRERSPRCIERVRARRWRSSRDRFGRRRPGAPVGEVQRRASEGRSWLSRS